MAKINWINSWQKGNKKDKFNFEIRIGRITLFEMKFCFSSCCKDKKDCDKTFRLIVLNFGFEI